MKVFGARREWLLRLFGLSSAPRSHSGRGRGGSSSEGGRASCSASDAGTASSPTEQTPSGDPRPAPATGSYTDNPDLWGSVDAVERECRQSAGGGGVHGGFGAEDGGDDGPDGNFGYNGDGEQRMLWAAGAGDGRAWPRAYRPRTHSSDRGRGRSRSPQIASPDRGGPYDRRYNDDRRYDRGRHSDYHRHFDHDRYYDYDHYYDDDDRFHDYPGPGPRLEDRLPVDRRRPDVDLRRPRPRQAPHPPRDAEPYYPPPYGEPKRRREPVDDLRRYSRGNDDRHYGAEDRSVYVVPRERR